MRWNMVCALVVALAVALELLALLLVMAASARAKWQADAVVAAVKRAAVVELSLRTQALGLDPRPPTREHPSLSSMPPSSSSSVGAASKAATPRVVATGWLQPKLSEDTGRLRFDGRVRVRVHELRKAALESVVDSQSRESEADGDEEEEEEEEGDVLVLHRQRGARISAIDANGSVSSMDVSCLRPDQLPPLHTIEAASRSAFTAQSWEEFGVRCARGRPLEVLFDRAPFVLCVRDWLDAVDACAGCAKAPPLVVYGERLVLEATLVFAPGEARAVAAFSSFSLNSSDNRKAMARCPLLEAPLATVMPATQSLLFQLLPPQTLPTRNGAPTFAQLA